VTAAGRVCQLHPEGQEHVAGDHAVGVIKPDGHVLYADRQCAQLEGLDDDLLVDPDLADVGWVRS
jgi:hypothetical protein